MMAAKVACPQCKAVLQLTKPPAGGQRVKCPKCGTPFALNGATPAGNAVQARAPAAQGTTDAFQGLQDAPEEDFSSITPAVRRRKSGGGMARFVAILLALGLVGAGVAVVVQQFFLNPVKEKEKPPPSKPIEVVEKGPPKVKKNDSDDFRNPLTVEKQAQVNKAIDAAVKYLKDTQGPDGRWPYTKERIRPEVYAGFDMGLAALPGLTLLECGVPAKDPVVQKAAKYVRERAAKEEKTYNIALAVLFLDRLGDPADKSLIQELALRLVAGQTGNGGWTYTCPILPPGDRELLLVGLKALPLVPDDKLRLELTETPEKPDPNAKLVLSDQPPGQNDDRPDDTKLVLVDQPPPPKEKQKTIKELPPHLKKLPVMQIAPVTDDQTKQKSDNSNTQFAVLALWAARRHEVPLDRTLALVVKRFRTSQYPTGSWPYGYVYTVGVKNNKWVGKDTMACAGLLGLAVGHGLANDLKAPGALGGRDPAVEKALRALGAALRMQSLGPIPKRPNLYLLWSVERVAMLYRLNRIGAIDWYTWGTDVLLARQEKDGSWYGNGFPGSAPSVDTSLALLFLRRVNLAQDMKLVLDVGEEKKP